jgi:hypothetical protein
MEIDAWLSAAVADVRKRGLPEVEPLLQALARMTEVLRNTDFGGGTVDEGAGPDSPGEASAPVTGGR